MMSFNVLDRHQEVHCNAMLEASAGTGKTFAIENIVVRLLIDSKQGKDPLQIEKILIVTFTRAATRDLKVRIRANLVNALNVLNSFIAGEEVDNCPDYLMAYIECGEEDALQVRRRIERALFSFDQAQIHTIHGFCWRMLQSFAIEGGVSLESACSEDESLPRTKQLRVVRDFFRTELLAEIYSPQQIKRVLKKFDDKADKLQKDLLNTISKGLEIIAPPPFADYFIKFQASMRELKDTYAFKAEKIVADFLLHAPAYRGLCNRSKQVHPEKIDKVRKFSELFDKDHWEVEDFDLVIDDGLYLVDALSQEQLAAKGVPPGREKLHYPDLLDTLKLSIGDLVEKARNPDLIFARMASDCQTLMKHYQNQEEMLGFNDLLQQMRNAIANPDFADKVRGSFDAVIVDEFQDTDPVQWEIFRALFADEPNQWKGFFYLVGDPKQSIYAFRQADIYTYLSAASTLGERACATLDTNFRSQPSLVAALNTLFSSAHNLFPLPRQATHLDFKHVKAGKAEDRLFHDGRPCLQFMLAKSTKKKTTIQEYESTYFFSAIAKEILQLNKHDGVRFNQCAVLVSDRFQAERLMQFFKTVEIPVISQRGINLADSMAVHAMRELLKGILHFRHPSALRIALGGRMIGMTHADISNLQNENSWENILEKCDRLRRVVMTEGLAAFFPLMMQSCWHADGKNVLQRLLLQQGGADFYREWQDIAELLIQEQSEKNLTPEGVLAFLDEFDMLALNEDERMKAALDHEQDGVPILTSHVSKGLEFDVVFTLGLIKRTSQNEILIPVQREQEIYLEAVTNADDSLYKKYCEEVDAEKMRQLYVAFTRAKSRLYIPAAIACGGAEVEHGAASPMDLFLSRLGECCHQENKHDYEDLYKKVRSYDGTALVEFIEKTSADIGLTVLEESMPVAAFKNEASLPLLFEPREVTIPGSAIFMHSFTSLAHAKNQRTIGDEMELTAPHEFNHEQKTTHTLPAGSDTGTLLHKIFENLPFQAAKNIKNSLAFLPWVRPAVEGTSFAAWQEVIADMAYRTLTTNLPGNHLAFCLADIDPKKIFRETEFLFPTDSSFTLQECMQRSGLIKGVIDLFFEHAGKYYLLDWKSNWLGPTQEHYTQKNLETAMCEHDYGLQARIYSEALRRYLKIFDKRPFEDIFGGTYYLFLRGIGPKTGILHLS